MQSLRSRPPNRAMNVENEIFWESTVSNAEPNPRPSEMSQAMANVDNEKAIVELPDRNTF